MANFNSNQFSQQRAKGYLTDKTNVNIRNCRILPTSVNSFSLGTAVKIVNGVSKVSLVEKALATEEIFGFIVSNFKKNTPVAGDIVEVAYDNSSLSMEAGAAIAAGALLEIVSASDKVITNAGVNVKIGMAMEQATADGDIIEVKIKTPVQI